MKFRPEYLWRKSTLSVIITGHFSLVLGADLIAAFDHHLEVSVNLIDKSATVDVFALSNWITCELIVLLLTICDPLIQYKNASDVNVKIQTLLKIVITI